MNKRNCCKCGVGLVATGLNYILFPPYIQLTVENMKRLRSDTGKKDASCMCFTDVSVVSALAVP